MKPFRQCINRHSDHTKHKVYISYQCKCLELITVTGNNFLEGCRKCPDVGWWLSENHTLHIIKYYILKNASTNSTRPGWGFLTYSPQSGPTRWQMSTNARGGGRVSTHGIDWAISLLQQFKWNTIKIRLPRLIIKAFYGSKILTILDFFTSRWTNWPLSSGYFGSWGHFAVVERLGNLRKRR